MENIAKKFLKLHPDLEKVEFIYVDFNGIPRGKNTSPKTLIKASKGGLKMPISSYVLDVWGDNPKGTGLVMSGDGDNRLLYIATLSSEYFRINISLSSISKKFA